MLHAALSGLLLAFGLILPLGVQNTFVFLQGATQPRWRRGVPVALTAALCDTALILLAVSGVSLLILQFPWLLTALRYGGVLFLLYLGWASWRSAGSAAAEAGSDWPVKRQIRFSLSVSLLNPHAIIDTVGVIGTTALSFAGGERAAYTAACILVSWLWFFGLLTAGHLVGGGDARPPPLDGSSSGSPRGRPS
jgi:L-lysine exporter family protein LysE/ArgO